MSTVAYVRVLASVVLVAGCTTMQGRADTAYAKGNYLEAAELYDQMVRDKPADAQALAWRTTARNAALHKMLTGVKTLRVARNDEGAVAQLTELLAQRDVWSIAVEAHSQADLTFEVDAAGAYIQTIVVRRARTAPLVAEQLSHRYDPLFARGDLAAWRYQVQLEVRTAGHAACRSIAPTATSPYWSWVVARYCAHWDAPPVAVRPLANLRPGLVVDGSIEGETDDESARLRTVLAAAFRTSVWFAPNTEPMVHATLSGTIAETFASEAISLSKDWTESVPYTDYETTQESYQEPYDDTESYSEQVPTTQYQTESYPCGDSTCTRSVPVTVYQSEQRTRTVTRYRTAYRSVTNPVTRYRDVPHVFNYNATRRTGRYSSSLTVHVDRGLPDLVATVTSDFTEQGIDHDASFAAAGVSPERADLMTPRAFALREEASLHDRLRLVLDDTYARLYCTARQYTLESAAACAYLDPTRAPPLVHATLHTVFRDDEPLLATVLTR